MADKQDQGTRKIVAENQQNKMEDEKKRKEKNLGVEKLHSQNLLLVRATLFFAGNYIRVKLVYKIGELARQPSSTKDAK